MQQHGFRFFKCGIGATVLLAAAMCWASKVGSTSVVLPNILPNGNADGTGTQTQFNYVLNKGKFHGEAMAKVTNASNKEAKFKNVGYLSDVTIKQSLYEVSPRGKAHYDASGTVP